MSKQTLSIMISLPGVCPSILSPVKYKSFLSVLFKVKHLLNSVTDAWPWVSIFYRCETYHYSAAVVSHKIRLETSLLQTAHEAIKLICKNNILDNITLSGLNT